MENRDFEIVPVGTKELIRELVKCIPGTPMVRGISICPCGGITPNDIFKFCTNCLREKVNLALGEKSENG